ncbi:MAG: hypothetical protein LVR00_00180 [Rhabdochlamydiaceae bacterium]|jgi:hypothetical protein
MKLKKIGLVAIISLFVVSTDLHAGDGGHGGNGGHSAGSGGNGGAAEIVQAVLGKWRTRWTWRN